MHPMHAIRSSQRLVVLALLLLMAAGAKAVSPVASWLADLELSEERSAGSPLVTQVLADGTAFVVSDDRPFVTFFRYGRDGELLSSTSVRTSGASTRSIAVDAFGGVFVAESDYVAGGQESWVMKYDGATGRRMWSETARVSTDEPWNYLAAAVAAPNGDVLLAGGFLARFDGATGRARWGPAVIGVDAPLAVDFDRAGDVVVSGTGPWSEDGGNVWRTFKVAGETGAVAWGPLLAGRPDIPRSCPMSCPDPRFVKNAFDPSGDVILTVNSFEESGNEFWLTLKYRGDTGVPVWGPVRFDPSDSYEWEKPSALAVDAAGDVIVAGSARTSPSLKVWKYAGSTGEARWGPVALASAGIESGGELALAGNGDPVVVGVGGSAEHSSWNAVRLNGRTGLVVWEQPLAAETGSGLPGAPAFFGDATALVTGLSSAPTRSDLRAVRFRLADGTLLWDRLPTSVDSRRSSPIAHMVDRDGDTVVVAGVLDTVGGDGAIVKYAGADGAVLWGPVPFEDGPRSWAFPAAAALDARGNVVVVGSVTVGADVYWQTIKFSGDDGGVIWGPIRSQARISGNEPAAVAFDARGDVLVTGSTSAGWSTLKYRGDDGTQLWESLTGAPAGFGQRVPAGVATDAAGDVIVAGILGENERDRAAAVKLDGATGAALWGPVYFEPHPGQSGQFTLMAVDSRGDLVVAGVSRNVGDSLGDGLLVKFEGESGAVAWSRILGREFAMLPSGLLLDPNTGDPVIRGQGFPDDEVSRWASGDGSLVWRLRRDRPYPPSGTGRLMVLGGDGSLILAGSRFPDGAAAIAYDAATGMLRWGPVALDPFGGTSPTAMVSSPAGFVVVSNSAGPAVTTSYALDFRVATVSEAVPPGACGTPFHFTLTAENGAEPYAWSLASGSLPEGLSVSGSGAIEGETTATGEFRFRVRASDSIGGSAERDLSIDVFDGGEAVPIGVAAEKFCTALSAPEGFAAYAWLPTGQVTRTIRACPNEVATFGLVVTETNGCRRRGSVEVPPAVPAARGPVLPAARRSALPRKP